MLATIHYYILVSLFSPADFGSFCEIHLPHRHRPLHSAPWGTRAMQLRRRMFGSFYLGLQLQCGALQLQAPFKLFKNHIYIYMYIVLGVTNWTLSTGGSHCKRYTWLDTTWMHFYHDLGYEAHGDFNPSRSRSACQRFYLSQVSCGFNLAKKRDWPTVKEVN